MSDNDNGRDILEDLGQETEVYIEIDGNVTFADLAAHLEFLLELLGEEDSRED